MDPSTTTKARTVPSVLRPAVWRGLAFAAVYLSGLAGFLAGVGVTERDLALAGLAEKAYYALGLFVLGGLDIGTPVGGPLYGQWFLWAAYFAAPVITASALIEAALRIIRPLALRVRPFNDHIVLGGAGRLTRLYVRKLRESDRARTVVVVERNPNHPTLAELRDQHRAIIVIGDVTEDRVLETLRLERARRILLLTGNDFANLDAASKMVGLHPGLAGRIVVHVADLGFMRETATARASDFCEVFNGHEAAAIHLVQEHLLERFHRTPERDLVVLAGFGRFGQTVLQQLQRHASGSFGHVLMIDEHSSRNVRAFGDQPGFTGDYRHTAIDGDLLDPGIWARIDDAVQEHGHPPVVVVGSGSDRTNLHAALSVRKQHPEAYVILRSFRASPFTVEISQEMGVHAFDLAGLIEKGMPDRWFE